MGSDKRLRLIDLDAATELNGDGDGRLLAHVGAKFSSGNFPPELFRELLNDESVDKFRAYFASIASLHEQATTRRRSMVEQHPQNTEDQELWQKIMPKRNNKTGTHFVVKTFRTDPENPSQPLNASELPYDLVASTSAVDIWGLGCLLYQLATGENLEPVTRDDDLTSGVSMARIMKWDKKRMQSKLARVSDDLARDLLSKLLSPSPEDREALNLEDLLKTHPYFHPETWNPNGSSNTALLAKIEEINERTKAIDDRTKAIDDRTKRIEGLAHSLKASLSQGVAELKKHVTAAADDTMPTCFVILPKQSDWEPSLVPADAEAAYKLGEHAITSAMQLYSSVSATVADPIGATKNAFKVLLAKDDFEMYLVCELCYANQSSPRGGGPWPILITKSSEETVEIASKLVPLAKATMCVGKAINGVAVRLELMSFSCFTSLFPMLFEMLR